MGHLDCDYSCTRFVPEQMAVIKAFWKGLELREGKGGHYRLTDRRYGFASSTTLLRYDHERNDSERFGRSL